MGIEELHNQEVRLKRELEVLNAQRLVIEGKARDTRNRIESLRIERQIKEKTVLGEVWREYWVRHQALMQMTCVKGVEKAGLSFEEVREINRERYRKYSKKRYKGSPETKLSRQYRRRAQKVLGASPLRDRSEVLSKLLGCSVKEWREHLEGQFEDGMSWENYGVRWDVDHIMPVSSFNLATLNGVKGAFNWLNTRPMWKWENNAKGAKITEPQYQFVFGMNGDE